MAAQVPDTPAAPTTTYLGDTVKISWAEPFSGGSEITGYQISIMQSDSTYSLELVDCDGSAATITANRECEVSTGTMRSAPFSLDWGDSVFAKVIAINTYGPSESSLPGNGAVIITYADAPINVAEIVELRTSSSISFSWS